MEDDTTMAQEDQTRNCGIGRSSKKPKQKKIPQRGLGVAQLEKIIEEQHKRSDGSVILPSPNSVSSSSSSSLSSVATISSYMPLQINNFNHSNNQPSSTTTPLPCGSQVKFRSLNGKVPSTVPLSNNCGYETGWPNVSVSGHGNVPNLWSSNEFGRDGFGIEPGLPFLQSLPFESNPICPMTNWVPRTPQYHQQMENISSGTSSTLLPHLPIEPPSNQNYCSSGVPIRPAEKVNGRKRPYPFSLDFPEVPAFNYKLHTSAAISTNAKTSCKSEIGFHFDGGNSTSSICREGSASKSEPNSKKRNKGIKDSDGHFLTLAPPTPISYPPSKYKSSTSLAFHSQECPEFDSSSSQENIEDQFHAPPGYRLFNQQKQPLHSFFLPAAKEAQIVQTAPRIQNCHEVEESVDLNLKL